jgi:hypothetical protein
MQQPEFNPYGNDSAQRIEAFRQACQNLKDVDLNYNEKEDVLNYWKEITPFLGAGGEVCPLCHGSGRLNS